MLDVPTTLQRPVSVDGTDLLFELWLEWEWWQPQPNDNPRSDFFNMQITLSIGQRYALNVWTFAFWETARQHAPTLGEQLAGRYPLLPDLFVEKLDRKLMEDIVTDLLRTNGLRHEWLCPPDEQAP
jgi:hypothetical protein